MKIPPRPPHTPLQDSILILLRESPRTKQELSEVLNRSPNRITRALRSLLLQEKIEQQMDQEMKYRLPASTSSQNVVLLSPDANEPA